ncbi:hypothetical protein [Streptomyces sp. PT12]|uniref:hypothetical protein n=1 Tax=Streptomyces sp. PT12 TaxID=1510197 RepID=UPI000DE31832|nr:hypothetical protein [Streptomyces sp. PT12]RBM12690.1 hypothetical protein DEH69_19810 [Streptomyces sp. PT12]
MTAPEEAGEAEGTGEAGEGPEARGSDDERFPFLALFVLCGSVLLIIALALLASPGRVRVTYAEGDRPEVQEKTYTSRTSSTRHRYFTWDVRERMEGVLRVEVGSTAGLIRISGMRGTLHLSVPEGCEDREIRWRITANGREAAAGSARWLSEYETRTDFSTDGVPREAVLTAEWDGPTAACPSFSVVWELETSRFPASLPF